MSVGKRREGDEEWEEYIFYILFFKFILEVLFSDLVSCEKVNKAHTVRSQSQSKLGKHQKWELEIDKLKRNNVNW